MNENLKMKQISIPLKKEIESQIHVPTYEIAKDDLLYRVLVFSLSGTCIVDLSSRTHKG